MKLYENVVIGNFLYALGFAVATKSKSKIGPSIVNLLQQTPVDKPLGDVLLAFPGIMRLIEFKNLKSRHKKEKTKHCLLTSAIGAYGEDTIELSKSIHWFVETTPKEQTLVSRIVPYLEAYPRENCQHSLEGFIETTAEDAIHGEAMFSDEKLCEYLDLVAHCQVSMPDEKSHPIQAGGILLLVDARGNLRFCELIDMMQLRLPHWEYVRERELTYERYERERYRARELERTRDQARELERQRELNLERSNSLSRGFEL